ncbi:hypothetical protein EBESD8_42250 [Rhodococcus aetherivorans]|nr:hypothetical protein EBESD8_42250 [Rhodococcus aetherivorans]
MAALEWTHRGETTRSAASGTGKPTSSKHLRIAHTMIDAGMRVSWSTSNR